MDVTEWLLDSDPSIRWQVMRDLLDAPADAVEAERARVAREGWAPRLLALQDDVGTGAAMSTARTATGAARTGRCTCCAGSASTPPTPRCARRRTRARRRRVAGLDHLPYFHGEVEECVNGGVLALAAYFGELGEGSDRIIARLLDERLDDGGWNCEREPGLDAVVVRLDDLRARGPARLRAGGRPASNRPSPRPAAAERSTCSSAASSGAARPARSCSPATLDFSFPPYWFYDVLRALDYFREAGDAPDPRIADAIESALGKRADDGRWAPASPWHGEVFFAVDAPEGEPSRWNTLRALRVLRWAGAE